MHIEMLGVNAFSSKYSDYGFQFVFLMYSSDCLINASDKCPLYDKMALSVIPKNRLANVKAKFGYYLLEKSFSQMNKCVIVNVGLLTWVIKQARLIQL